MKIVHLCISAPYIDNWGYQENLLPNYLNTDSVENFVVACKNVYPTYLQKNQIKAIQAKGDIYQIEGVKIYRISCSKITTTFIIPYGLKQVLKQIKPDVIFHHGINSSSLLIASLYAKHNKCLIMADNHADDLNISRNRFWNIIYHKILVRYTIRFFCDNVQKFYGVTNARCRFLSEYYKINQSKIDFLPIGADIKKALGLATKEDLRRKYGFNISDKILISGGKMGVEKGTDKLISAVNSLNKDKIDIKLVLFGKFEDQYTEKLARGHDYIYNFGWCDRKKTLELLKLADIACWPVHHTTLIEDSISVLTPLMLRKTSTTEHLIRNNGFWINGDLVQLLHLFWSDKCLESTLREGCEDMCLRLSYSTLAKKIITDINLIQKSNDVTVSKN